MEPADDIFAPAQTRFHASGDHWQNTLELLKLVQNDYQGARQQLEQVGRRLAQGEALVNQQLQNSYLAAGGYRTPLLPSSRFPLALPSVVWAVLRFAPLLIALSTGPVLKPVRFFNTS
jgi:hypothetical protein